MIHKDKINNDLIKRTESSNKTERKAPRQQGAEALKVEAGESVRQGKPRPSSGGDESAGVLVVVAMVRCCWN